MKKLHLLIATAIFTYVGAIAQIPNNSFEKWTTMGSYSNPEGWGTMNNKTASAKVYTATKGTPGSAGAAYLILTSLKVGSSVVNGIAVSGKLDSITMKPISGFAFNQRPTALTGKWQFMGSNPGSISVTLTKWNSSTKMRETIGTASKTLSGMAMSWASFSIPFTYSNSSLPDTCIIVLEASGSKPVVNDYLWVDNLNFTGIIATKLKEEAVVLNSMTVYPNPASNYITLNFNTLSPQLITIKIVDVVGKVVLIKNISLLEGNSKEIINTSSLATGSYYVNTISKDGNVFRKLIINRK
ncbi:MAG: T9SS type A sorting domain-containing protein [Bacteroidia bacterium]